MKRVIQIMPIQEFPIEPQNPHVVAVGIALVDYGESTGCEFVVRDDRRKFIEITVGAFRGYKNIQPVDLDQKRNKLPFGGLWCVDVARTETEDKHDG